MAPPRVSSSVQLPPFESLIDAHAAELHRFLVGLVGAPEAEDCLQETFMSALRAYPRLRHGENLRAWLYTIAQRKATDAVRRGIQRPTASLDGVEPAQPAVEPSDDGLWRLVRGLPPKQRTAVFCRTVLGMPYEELARLLESSEDAARRNVFEGLRTLREGWTP